MEINYFPLKNNAKKKQLKVIYNDRSSINAALPRWSVEIKT